MVGEVPPIVVEGEKFADDAAPAEVLDETERRLRDDTVDNGVPEEFRAAPALTALNPATSDAFEERRGLRTASEEGGRLLKTD
jgi:hypothetical protein